MKFLDLSKQYKSIKKEIDSAMRRVVASASFIGGEEVDNFEKEFAKFCGARYAVSVNSGTDALYLSLKAVGIEPGDEIVTTPFTFIATAEAIANCGAKPIFVDINPDTFNIDSSKIKEKLDRLKKFGKLDKVKAIIPVHLFGQMSEMGEIMKIAKSYKLCVIEDAAQAVGAKIRTPDCAVQKNCTKLKNEATQKWKRAGSVGDCGCFSFFPSKNLGAYGDGGMLITNKKKIADKVKLMRNHGSSGKKKHKSLVLGTNSRLDSIQAAILRVKLKYIDMWNKERELKAGYYSKRFEENDCVPAGSTRKHSKVTVPRIDSNKTHIFHQYTIRVCKNARNKLAIYLRKREIPTMIYYPVPIHLQTAFKYLGHAKGDFPESEKASREVLSLPIYPEINKKDQDFAICEIKNFLKNCEKKRLRL